MFVFKNEQIDIFMWTMPQNKSSKMNEFITLEKKVLKIKIFQISDFITHFLERGGGAIW